MIPIILIYLLRFCTGQSPEIIYVVNMDSQLECCDEESSKFLDVSGVTVERYNETIAYMFGQVELLQPVGAGTMIELIVQKEISGKYETIGTHEICEPCSEVAKGPESDYYNYMKYFTIPDECPFEVKDGTLTFNISLTRTGGIVQCKGMIAMTGGYPINDFVVDTEDLPLNCNTAGRYQAFMSLYKNPEKDCKTNKEFLFCLTLKFIIEMV